VLNSDGTIRWTGTAGTGGQGYGPISIVADINMDGDPDIVAGNTVYRASGEILWHQTQVPDGYNAVGNFDADPFPEIVLVSGGKVWLLEHTGAIKWGPYAITNGGKGGPPTVADFDGDGEPEIGVAGAERYSVFDTDGRLLWETKIQDVSSHATGSSVFDFEGDGSPEVVYRDELYLRIYRGTDGAVRFQIPMSSCTGHEYVLVADVDNDNNAEIVAVANNNCGFGPQRGIYVFGDANDTWVNTRKIWNQHGYSITNINDDGTIPQYPANNWEIFNNFRQNEMLNPFGCNDLTASYVRVDNSNLPGAIGILTRVGNGGALHVAPGISVAFYEGDPNSGGTLLGTVQINRRLYPGDYEEVRFTAASPSSGMKEFYVVADDDGTGRGKLFEIDEKNNKAHTFFNLNFSPAITSSPVTSGAEGEPYSYDVEATDPEEDGLTYSLATRPAGMVIDSVSGLITWSPGSAQAGDHSVEVQVDDGQGGFSRQRFVITVKEALNTPPKITSSPPLTLYDSENYAYQVLAQDLDGDLLNFALTTAPEGVTISPAGLVSWPKSTVRPELANVAILVTDGRGGIDTQSWQIAIVPVPPPQIAIAVTPEPATLGDTVIIQLHISSYLEVVDVTLTVNGDPVPLINGQASYITTKWGNFLVEATATDVRGSIGTASRTFRVLDPSDIQPPEISVALPAGLTVEVPYEVIGTISDPSLIRYEIELAPQGSNQYRVVAEGKSVVENGKLGVIDPTAMANGLYELRITAYDANGNVSRRQSAEPIEINSKLKIGQFSLAFQDIAVPVAGIPITVQRIYNSFNKQKGDFGVGWDMALYSGIKVQITRELGTNWRAEQASWWVNGWTYRLVTDRVPKVLVTYANGRQDRFEFTPRFATGPPYLDPRYVTPEFTPLEGTASTLEAMADNDLILYPWPAYPNGNRLLDSSTNIYNPDRFRLTTAEGMSFVISKSSGLQSITDLNGNTISFSASGISHSSGLSISMQRDTQGRIVRITDPIGYEVWYTYDGNGDLVKFTNQEGGEFLFAYDGDHNLVSIVDPRGVEVLSTTYDEQGRMIATRDGLGRTTAITHDKDAAVEYVTDRNGKTTAYAYDTDGNIVRVTDPEGNQTFYTYDERGNKLSKTDALGNTTRWTFDEFNNKLSETDPLGHTRSWTYNSRNQILTATDPIGNLSEYRYDDRGNLTRKIDALNEETTYTYDAAGNRVSMTDCQGHVTTYAYDAYGNKTAEIDALGNRTEYLYDTNGNLLTERKMRSTATGQVPVITQYVYDSMGRRIQTIDAEGNTSTTEFNAIGKKSADEDKNGNRTEYEYDGNGNLVLTRDADGTQDIQSYDGNGNRISSTDRAGRITTYEYFAASHGEPGGAAQNQLKKITHADGSGTSFEYDAAGRMTVVVDEAGNRSQRQYDAAGRLVKTIDAQGYETLFAYDAAGNQVSMTDANGHTTSYEYDELNRREANVFHDGTSTAVAYASGCGADRKVAETDQAGNTTNFGYDALGRLIRVTDALGGVTRYAYDQVGNRISQTDPNNHVTSFTYDNLGRMVRRTLPMGQTETLAYDPNGNLSAKIDFKGNTCHYEYDEMNRLVKKEYLNGSSIEYTYTASGKRETVLDSRGETEYTYDSRDRLVSVRHPNGSVISYSYDLRGNRTSLNVPSGTTTYSFDALNRLVSVTDPDGGLTGYTYYPAGNRAAVTYPNGTKASYTYDALNRLIRLENRKSTGEIISSYAYTLDVAGNRTRVVENTGRVVDYTYDALYRLVGEEIQDDDLGDKTIFYTYDGFGNRLEKIEDGVVTAYSYNANDQLITESSPANSVTYAYDANGNTVAKDDGTHFVTYTYAYENRLVTAQHQGGTSTYQYDDDGIRVRSQTGAVGMDYLVDKNRPYSQVLEERDAAGKLIVDYVYGDGLISQTRDGGTSYYHYDGQMSTRKLTNVAATATDSYVYDAFGVAIDHNGSSENSYLYTGEQYISELDYYYLRARYFNQNLGRLNTPDQLPGNVWSPLTNHKYIYAINNPISNIDPSGNTASSVMEPMSALGILAALVGYHVIPAIQFAAAASVVNLYDYAFELRKSGILLLSSPNNAISELGYEMINKADGLVSISQTVLQTTEDATAIVEYLLTIQSGLNALGSLIINTPTIISVSSTLAVKCGEKAKNSANATKSIAVKLTNYNKPLKHAVIDTKRETADFGKQLFDFASYLNDIGKAISDSTKLSTTFNGQ
jgi:RHS repeat-associated protein